MGASCSSLEVDPKSCQPKACAQKSSCMKKELTTEFDLNKLFVDATCDEVPGEVCEELADAWKEKSNSDASAERDEKVPIAKEFVLAEPELENWEFVDPRTCDPEYLVIAALQACWPQSLKRYMSRRAQLKEARAFEYSSSETGLFRITVGSHNLTLDSDMAHWQAILEEKKMSGDELVFIRVIGRTCLAAAEVCNGDRTKLRLVPVLDLPDDAFLGKPKYPF
eukprot:TRINITY_DN1516_c0_g6_i1.p1 TRINITY_DN1516_c0_g6~~TRINITY_DN1516_c0_g6_i1.p1  ORF type:complete len:223 (+),score=54.97 TRINITY_DN1516_c0_g6_i1:92-760(+)